MKFDLKRVGIFVEMDLTLGEIGIYVELDLTLGEISPSVKSIST